jgi:hypothetical protein
VNAALALGTVKCRAGGSGPPAGPDRSPVTRDYLTGPGATFVSPNPRAFASQNSQIGKPYSIALLLFKAGDKHQTLFFPALVSNCSFLHKEALSG